VVLTRPRPPAEMLANDVDRPAKRFIPAIELSTWLTETFIVDGAPLLNEDHAHLSFARIGALWTSVPNSRSGRTIVGQAEFLKNSGGAMGKWARAAREQQLEEWFGEAPDFLITIDAGYAAQCTDAAFCALIEHEAYHCGIERDEFGAPRFSKAGTPIFGLRGHDVEEFVGVVRRYGADAAGVRDMVDAASKQPEVAVASIAAACGNCMMPRLVRA
jgi:putative metallopeptidase